MGLDSFIKKILPPEDQRFYEFFECGAELAFQASKLFNEIIDSGLTEDKLIRAKNLKGLSVDNTKNALSELNRTFVTPIDREDILYIAILINKITKRIIRGCLNWKIYRIKTYPELVKNQAETLMSATNELKIVVGQLHKASSMKEVSESNHRMMEIEAHGDEILYHAMEEIFSGRYEPLEVIKLRDTLRTIESALDNCFNVSDTILNIVIKHG